MAQYKAPLSDIRYLMNDVIDFPAHYAALPGGADIDSETIDMMLGEPVDDDGSIEVGSEEHGRALDHRVGVDLTDQSLLGRPIGVPRQIVQFAAHQNGSSIPS